ncbi:DUF4424 domain-containing protein [Aureimonas sp. D3]|uniref:DUF4424 domain-containing protein n=1 Tax=Aureimonas sp. D3 TaxID=1638164 RepID=UPI000785CAF0|nr:DUF4424 domain-containing protein [Aureimonas sp. D3]
MGARAGQALAGALLFALPLDLALANDTMAQLGTQGLTFVRSDRIEMRSEDLFVSPDEIRITYQFHNNGPDDEDVLVAFPMPDIEGSMDFMTSVPTDDPQNLFGFTTTFEGKPVSATFHPYAFAAGIERTQVLLDHKIPLVPHLAATHDAVQALDEPTRRTLRGLGLVMPTEYEEEGKTRIDDIPIWLLRSTYSWHASFPAGKTVTVEHRYKPSLGATAGVSFLNETEDGPARLAATRQKYCLGDDILARLKASGVKDGTWTSYPYVENWISYIWSTGANWAGTVGHFTLTVDKGDPKNLVSFCGENVRKIGPTTFRMEAENWSPPWERELDILLLVPQKP